jgi:hypothetical protein
MPVILPPELYDFWLNEDSREPELKEILTPFPASEMTSHAVSYEVNDAKSEGEHLLRPVEPNIGVNLNIVPVSGLPLPFISYGGSGLTSLMLGIGLVESVAMRHRQLDF